MSPIEDQISRVLRAGVAASLLLITAGTIVSFIHHPDYVASARALERLTQPGIAPHSLGAVASGLRDVRGQAVVMLGLLVLILTPIVRVAMSLTLFRCEQDRAFTAITALVLVLILLSVLMGWASSTLPGK